MERMYIMILLILLGATSCRSVDDIPGIPEADQRYLIDDFEPQTEKRVTFSNPLEKSEEIRFVDATLYDLSEFLRKNTIYSLCTNALDIRISGLFVGGVSKIVHDIALSNNLKYGRIQDTFYIYSGDASSFDVTVSLNSRVPVESLSTLFDGKLIYDNGRVVFRGSFDKALELQGLIDAFDDVKTDNYCVTVVQVETSKQLAYSLQVDLMSKGVDLLTPGVSAWDVFSASARAAGSVIDFDNYHERQFYVSDGKRITYNHTFDKKLEQRSISDQGTSTVSGYTDVQAGSIIELMIKRSLNNSVLLSYDLELSNFDAR